MGIRAAGQHKPEHRYKNKEETKMFDMTPYDRRLRRMATSPFLDFGNWEKSFFGDLSQQQPRIDIRETEDAYILEADLPGFRREDIRLDRDGNYLTLSAKREQETSEKDKRGNYVRQERVYGSFSRSFDITGIDEEGISASYTDGVLTLDLPKRKEKAAGAKSIEIR